MVHKKTKQAKISNKTNQLPSIGRLCKLSQTHCLFKETGHFLMMERCKVGERICCQGDSLMMALGINKVP